jgi:hypothetical protein
MMVSLGLGEIDGLIVRYISGFWREKLNMEGPKTM